jgi:hypothetical protein
MVKSKQIKAVSGWLALILSLLLIVSEVGVPALSCENFISAAIQDAGNFLLLFSAVSSGLLFAVIGRILTIYRPENSIGWLVTLLGLTIPLSTALSNFNDCARIPNSLLLSSGWSAWLVSLISPLTVILLFVLLPSLFPTGAFLSNTWKSIILGWIGITISLTLLAAVTPGPMTLNGIAGMLPMDNPLALPFPGLRRLEKILYSGIPLSAILATLTSIAAFITRFRRSSGDERQQFKWFAYFLITVVFVHIVGFELVGDLIYPAIFEHWSYGLMLVFSLNGFPVVIGLAVFKYRLYDIDLIIRRTLAYAILTALLALVYFGGIAGLQQVFSAVTGTAGSPVAVVISTLAIAALFNPLRQRLQDFIDRRFYRRGYDAQKTLESFAAQARSEVELVRLTEGLMHSIQDALQPEKINLWLKKL